MAGVPESIRSHTLCFNSQHSLVRWPGGSIWYTHRMLGLWLRRGESRNSSGCIWVTKLAFRSFRQEFCKRLRKWDKNRVSFIRLTFLILTSRMVCRWRRIHSMVGVCWKYRGWCRYMIKWTSDNHRTAGVRRYGLKSNRPLLRNSHFFDWRKFLCWALCPTCDCSKSVCRSLIRSPVCTRLANDAFAWPMTCHNRWRTGCS